MPDLRSQRLMAARIMKCGATKVWMDPTRSADIADAITAEDVRRLISDKVIVKIPKSGISGYRINVLRKQKKKGRRLGRGTRKGTLKARTPKKKMWMSKIRAMRRLISGLKKDGRIDGGAYRDVYVKSKSGFFRSKSHVMIYLERNNLLKKEKGKNV